MKHRKKHLFETYDYYANKTQPKGKNYNIYKNKVNTS